MELLSDRDKQLFLLGLTTAFRVLRRQADCEHGVAALTVYLDAMNRALECDLEDPATIRFFNEILETINYHTAMIFPEWRDHLGRAVGQVFRKH